MTRRITTETTREDVYTRVTNRIVEQLEQGVRPWTKPWNAGDAAGIAVPLRVNGKPYRGANVLILWMEAMARGYTARFWMTYRQAAELGGQVRKGEKGTMVVFSSTVTRTETDDDGEALQRQIRFLRTYYVFNAHQIDGLPAPFYTPPATPEPTAALQRIEHVEQFVALLKHPLIVYPNLYRAGALGRRHRWERKRAIGSFATGSTGERGSCRPVTERIPR